VLEEVDGSISRYLRSSLRIELRGGQISMEVYPRDWMVSAFSEIDLTGKSIIRKVAARVLLQ